MTVIAANDLDVKTFQGLMSSRVKTDQDGDPVSSQRISHDERFYTDYVKIHMGHLFPNNVSYNRFSELMAKANKYNNHLFNDFNDRLT